MDDVFAEFCKELRCSHSRRGGRGKRIGPAPRRTGEGLRGMRAAGGVFGPRSGRRVEISCQKLPAISLLKRAECCVSFLLDPPPPKAGFDKEDIGRAFIWNPTNLDDNSNAPNIHSHDPLQPSSMARGGGRSVTDSSWPRSGRSVTSHAEHTQRSHW